jgi:hypothetical protein
MTTSTTLHQPEQASEHELRVPAPAESAPVTPPRMGEHCLMQAGKVAAALGAAIGITVGLLRRRR